MRWFVAILLLAGCDDPGPDIDDDGITDDQDDCIAGDKDRAVDADGDGKTAAVDLCPHDTNAVAGDTDFDDIPDACDPFLGVVMPDTRRCITSFSYRHHNEAYLVARDGEQTWNLAGPLAATASDTVSVVSTRELAFRSVTFDLLATAHFADPTASFLLWLRAGDAPSPKDVGCGVDGGGNLWVLADGVHNAIRTVPAPIDGPFRLRATVQAGNGQTVLCRVTVGGQTQATTFGVAVPVGSWGFASTRTAATITSLVIDSRDDAPPF